jgi:TonB family protein
MHAAFIAVFMIGGRYERMSLGGLGPGDFTPVTLVGAEALRGRAPAPPAPKVTSPAPKEEKEERKVEPPAPKLKPSEEGVKIPDQNKKPAKAKADTAARAASKEPAPKPARPAAKSGAEEALAGATETNAGHGGAVASGIEVGLGGEGGGGGGGGGGGFGEFSYYQLAMQNKIAAHWSPGFISGEAVTIVYFRIIRSGTIVGARVEESSGIPFYDQTALRAVLEASPLPPLPAQFPDDAVGVHFRFRFRP